MRKLTDTMIVKRIDWESNSTDMMVTCLVQNGIFNYGSILVLPGSDLNKLLSQLQKQNTELDFNDCLKIEQWSESETHYIFDFAHISGRDLHYEKHFTTEKLKQIRA